MLAVVLALREGWQSYLDDPAAVNATMASLNRDMKPEVMAASAALLPEFVASEATAVNGLGWMEPGRWDTLAQQLLELGELKEPVDASAAFVNLPIVAVP